MTSGSNWRHLNSSQTEEARRSIPAYHGVPAKLQHFQQYCCTLFVDRLLKEIDLFVVCDNCCAIIVVSTEKPGLRVTKITSNQGAHQQNVCGKPVQCGIKTRQQVSSWSASHNLQTNRKRGFTP